MKNFYELFEKEHQFYLEKIEYGRINIATPNSDLQLTIKDSIDHSIETNKLNIVFTRKLVFSPESFFNLSISFGAILTIKKEYRDYNWDELDLQDEFLTNGGFVINNLISRTNLLVAEITSSFGQSPIILPPNPKTES